MTQLVVLLDLPLFVGIAAVLGPVDQKSCRPAERKPCPESGRKRNTGCSCLSIPKRIGLEGMRPCIRMNDCHVSDSLSLGGEEVGGRAAEASKMNLMEIDLSVGFLMSQQHKVRQGGPKA